MDNKLVFEPTTLTQYNWNKYQLIENRTYKWDKYEAVPEYLYTYYWNKYEAIPPGTTNQWGVYDVAYPSKVVYADNLVVQNVSVYLPNYQPSNRSLYHIPTMNCMLRVFRNEDCVINDNNYTRYFQRFNTTTSPYIESRTRINNTKKGAYLRLSRHWFEFPTASSDTQFPAYIDAYGAWLPENVGNFTVRMKAPIEDTSSDIKIYLAKNLYDIVNNTNLINLEEDLRKKGIQYTENHDVVEEYIKKGYIYSFAPNNSFYGIRKSAYEDGLLTGYSDMYYASQGGVFTTVCPRYNGYYCVPNTSMSYMANYYYHGGSSYSEVSSINLAGLCAEDNIGLIGVLTNQTVLTYNPSSYYKVVLNRLTAYHLDILPSLNYNELYPLTNMGGDTSYYPYPASSIFDSDMGDSGYNLIYPASVDINYYGNPVKLGLVSYAYNTDIHTYPINGISGNYWYEYKGETTLDDYQPGAFIETLNSNVDTTYPENGMLNDYWYILERWTRDVVNWHIGSFLEKVQSNTYEYPENGVFPEDLEDYPHFWYSSLGYESIYSKGNYLRTASSFIESSYPTNSFIINDGWYEFIGTLQVLVGELVIDNSLLMGGVNYTQEINPSEDLQIGTPGAAQIDFTIFAPDASAATQYLGKDFTYYVKMNSDNDWRQIGTFTLTKAELPDKQTAKIQGFDYIYKFDTIIDEWLDEQTFPMTLGDMFASLCEYVGCEAYSTDFTNSDFMVNDNFEAVQITGRTILQYITEASGGFCVAEPDGRIHLKHYAIPPTGAVNLGNNSYRKYTHEIYNVPVISSVVVRKDDDDEGVESNV